MKITSVEEYGLRCLVQLASHSHENRPVAISEIAKAEGLSVQYVGKLMHELRRGGLITSVRGIHGGFTLARPPQDISIADVFAVLGGETAAHICSKYSGNQKECVHLGGCSIRSVWAFIMNQVNDVLAGISLADLAQSEDSCSSKLVAQLKTTHHPLPAHPVQLGGITK